jgi:GNAT superfamily N-acetyltransferase
MVAPAVRIATEADETRVLDVLVRAFSADPVARWLWPDQQQYLSHAPSFMKAFGGKAFTHGSAYHVDGYRGAALWLLPGVHFDEDAVVALLQRSMAENSQKDGFALFEQMGRYHPDEPHWYLPLMGVDPLYQGKGLGSALMKEALAKCDNDSRPAYLESSNPKNIPLYKRHGFELLGTIQVGASPPVFPMLRKPR